MEPLFENLHSILATITPVTAGFMLISGLVIAIAKESFTQFLMSVFMAISILYLPEILGVSLNIEDKPVTQEEDGESISFALFLILPAILVAGIMAAAWTEISDYDETEKPTESLPKVAASRPVVSREKRNNEKVKKQLFLEKIEGYKVLQALIAESNKIALSKRTQRLIDKHLQDYIKAFLKTLRIDNEGGSVSASRESLVRFEGGLNHFIEKLEEELAAERNKDLRAFERKDRFIEQLVEMD